MNRRAERRWRVAAWGASVAAGATLTIVAWTWLGVGSLGILAVGFVLGHRSMIASPGVPVLTYHSVSPAPGWLPWSKEIAVHPDTLARHLSTLDAMNCPALGTRDYLARRRAGEPIPPDTVLLHFDDGYRDNWLHAAPLLRRHCRPATFFASLDFIEGGDAVRPGDDDRGYMNWAELAAIEAEPLLEVEPHGVDHARVPVSGRVIGRLTAANWRRHAWLQWSATPGPKHEWLRLAAPVAVPLGAPIPQSAPALAARRWSGGALESEALLEARIAADLARCCAAFRDRLGLSPTVFCWPENAVCDAGRRIAAEQGYWATTGGCGRNTAAEPVAVLSRIHMGDRALGFRWPAAEALHLRAAVRLAAGNHYWYLLVAPMNLVRRVVMRLRDALCLSYS